MTCKRLTVLVAVVMLGTASLSAQSIPKPLKTRLVVGDPVWRELPVRSDIQKDYERVWQTALNTILEHNYDIATMEKASGYLRTTWNESVVVLKDNWYYKLQISVKLVTSPTDSTTVEKIRLQVTGDVTNLDSKTGGLKAYFRGYDQVVLQNLMQDLQAKLGAV
ncbi:MAG: hypothetical protein HYX77_08080 [Acidobacteria bacterium]|nr:hypothetical protein [Acidobacteriota bacterium]